MSETSVRVADAGNGQMNDYDARVWDALNSYWRRRDNAKGLPNWVQDAATRAGDAVGSTAARGVNALPDAVTNSVRDTGAAVAARIAEPVVHAATALLELVNDWMLELNDPATVEKHARRQGLEIDHFGDLRQHELCSCDRVLTRHTLKWRSLGAV